MVPTHSIANDLSWVEERSAVALANFMPHVPQEAARIARLRVRCLMSWPNDSSSKEEEDGQVEEEEDGQVEEEEDGQAEEEEDEQEDEEDPTDVEEQGEVGPKSPSGGVALEQGETEQEVEPRG